MQKTDRHQEFAKLLEITREGIPVP